MNNLNTVQAVQPAQDSNSLSFSVVTPQVPRLWVAIKKIFKDVLEPLYGSQEGALKKIGEAKDRKCLILQAGKTPVGVLAFKTLLSDEFENCGIKKSIEIKSLFVVDAGQNSGRGLGSALFSKAIEEFKALNLEAESIHVTVSETKKESLQFFLKKGFVKKYFWVNKYARNTKEYVLACAFTPAEKDKSDKVSFATHQLFVSKKQEAVEKKEECKSFKSDVKNETGLSVLGHVQNAHWDDIHFLRKLSDGTFVSASKDHALYKWDREGKLVTTVREIEPMGIDQKEWVTALEVINDEYWVTGERNGRVSLWSVDGKFVKDIKPKLPKSNHKSNAYNTHRVTTIAAGVNKNKLSFYIGFPTKFDEYSPVAGKTISTALVHRNDWVYCIHPLDEKSVLSVRAGYLEKWRKKDFRWAKEQTLIQEGQKLRNTRQHISSLVPLISSPNQFGLSIFGGYVKVFDLAQEKIIREWKEHKGRVWAIENVFRETFASSGEDGFVKVWDTRAQSSVQSIKLSKGDVTALMRYDDSLFIAGTYSKDALEISEGAKLVYYDIRK
jgi:WD40 repeat protein